WLRAVRCAQSLDEIVVTTDCDAICPNGDFTVLLRESRLAQDDTLMLPVVQDALQRVPGHPSDIIVLLQPTSPLRTKEHVRAASKLLRHSQAHSVVSISEVLRTDTTQPPTYRADGTVYAFWRRTVTEHGSIYGARVEPLVIPPEESGEIDTEADFLALEQRYR